VRAGDTLIAENDRHLWVIRSDPEKDDQRVRIVTITTLDETKDQACVLPRGCHPFVTHDSCVAYKFARVAALADPFALKDCGKLQPCEPVSPGLLDRMRRAAADSTSLSDEHAQILIDQGLLDL
jgi:hypothetical protein